MTQDRTTATDRGCVVVVDDDPATRLSLGQMLRLRGYRVELFSSAEAAHDWAGLSEVDCVISDIKMPGMDGEEFLGVLVREEYAPPVLMLTGHGDVSMAVRCLKAGAYDFIEKPFDPDVLLAAIQRAVEKRRLQREAEDLRRRIQESCSSETGRYDMIGRGRPMQELYGRIEQVARSNAPVLIVGETGSGKELVARAIHRASARAAGPFVPLNAGALPESMMESELFGHARGAFTGAEQARDGKLVAASGGTILLDEIECLSLPAQVRLLRVLEDGLVVPIGKDRPREVDIRLLATTKVQLDELVEQGRMREDFFHRIMVLSIHVPPLRERGPEDLSLLIGHFLRRSAEQNGVPVPSLPEEVPLAMMRHPWPGNVRELRNVIERMVVMGEDGTVGAFTPDEDACSDRLLSLPPSPGTLRDELESTERRTIQSALRDCDGRIGATSKALGISRRALFERMKKYALHKEDFRP
jgi:two-component system C4-dicarboxylate transport response regulator DctD